jgi:drug/metabolite transporter (DMT)-like permease
LGSISVDPADPGAAPAAAGRRTLDPGAVYVVLFLVVLALGVNWPVMSIALRSVSPLWMAVFRLVAATATVLVLTAATGRLEMPHRRDYPVVASVAVFGLVLVFVLVFFALEIVPPGRSSILVWTAGLWTVPLAVAFVGESMGRRRWLGLITGIAGMLLVFEPTRLAWTDGRVVLGHGMLLGAAFTHAGVAVHIRRHRWVSTPLRLLPWQLAAATLPMAALALAVEGLPSVAWTPGLAANLAFQGVVVSGFATWGQMTVLRSHTAIGTNLVLMLVPVVGLLSSVLVVGETLTVAVVAGLVLVVAGVATARVADSGPRVRP